MADSIVWTNRADHRKVTKIDNPEVRGAFLQVWNDNGNDPALGDPLFAEWLAGVRDNAAYYKIERNDSALRYLDQCLKFNIEPDKHRLIAILSGRST